MGRMLLGLLDNDKLNAELWVLKQQLIHPMISSKIPQADRPPRHRQTRFRFSHWALILLGIWFIMIIAWIALSAIQVSGKFLKRTITVQFRDEYMGALGTFSGLYILDQRSSWLIFGGRKKYIAANGNAKFEYCVGHENVWMFSYADTPDVEVDNPCAGLRNFVWAQSGKSDAFDLTRKPLDKWYYQSKSNLTTQLLPLQHFSIGNAERKEQKDCGSHGNFDHSTKLCDCHDGYFGLNCQLGLCQTIQTKDGFLNNETHSWLTKYTIHQQSGTGSPLLQAYNHLVFVGMTREGESDVIFFTGRCWVLSCINDIASLFSSGFHGHCLITVYCS